MHQDPHVVTDHLVDVGGDQGRALPAELLEVDVLRDDESRVILQGEAADEGGGCAAAAVEGVVVGTVLPQDGQAPGVLLLQGRHGEIRWAGQDTRNEQDRIRKTGTLFAWADVTRMQGLQFGKREEYQIRWRQLALLYL